MPHYACMVQEGQVADRSRERLADGLVRLAAETFDQAPSEVEIRWVVIREGFGFTAGKPSTSSLIARSVPTGFTDEERHVFMVRVSDLWREVTGCHPDEVVVTTLDGPLPLI
jgi:phenylpyruvate tautomerase PptA (4-oxalocrotonate tautomerase family)